MSPSNDPRCSISVGRRITAAGWQRGPQRDAHLREALCGSGDQARGDEGADQRTRHQRTPELLEDHRGVGQPETNAPLVLWKGQGEHPGLPELAPPVGIHDRRRPLGCSDALQWEAPLAEGSNALGERDLVVGELKVHGVTGLT